MRLTRPVAALFASCVAKTLLYPLDTMKFQSMVAVNMSNGTLFRGIQYEFIGNGISTYAYYSMYERLVTSGSILQSAAAASLLSSSLYVLFDIHKKRVQAGYTSRRITPRHIVTSYLLLCITRLPKTCIHYATYERLLFWLTVLGCANSVAGAIGGMMSTIVSMCFMYPFDVMRAQLASGRTEHSICLWRSVLLSIGYRALSSAIGHGIMEHLAPHY